MRLTVNDKAIALPLDGKINIERVSPFMNDNSGSYSFPFPVPTLPNQQNLDWPGKLQRVGDIIDQTFISPQGNQNCAIACIRIAWRSTLISSKRVPLESWN